MSSRQESRLGCRAELALLVLGLGLLALGGAFLALNLRPGLLAKALGFRHEGSVASLRSPEPPHLMLDGVALDQVDVVAPPLISEPLSLTVKDVDSSGRLREPLLGNASAPDKTTYVLTIDEECLNRLVQIGAPPTGNTDGARHNVTVDLQPGGLILYNDIDLGLRKHRMGVLFVPDGDGLQLSRAGIVVGRELYSMPPSANLVKMALPTGRTAERTLNALTITGPLPGVAHPTKARFHSDRLQVETEATYALSSLADTGWRTLEEGVELRAMDVSAGTDRSIERLHIVRLDVTHFDVRVLYDPETPRTISGWADESGALVVVNGSYFTPESEQGHETVGLVISDGQRWGSPLQDFAGMLAIGSNADVSVRWLRESPFDPNEPLDQAVQSFPVLVKPGGILGFPADADDGEPSRRTVVGQDLSGSLLLMVAPRGTLSLHELATFLTEAALDVDVAVNLDGGRSTGMWLAAENGAVRVDSATAVPTVIVAARR